MAPVWNALLQKSGSDGVFLTWEWTSTWLEVYGDEVEPLVLVAHDGGELCGIAPLMICRGASRFGQLARSLRFIGDERDITPEYLDFIVPRGLEGVVTRPLVDELVQRFGDRWDFVSLGARLRASPERCHLLSGFAQTGVHLHPVGAGAAPYAELPESWEEFLQLKSSHFRRQHNNRANRLSRAGQVRYRLGGRDLPVPTALEHIIRLHRDRWQEAGAAFRSERASRFHELLCERLAPLGWVALLLMELDGQVVAGRYDYVYDGKLWSYQGGWSREHRELKLGELILAATTEWAIQRRLRELDFLGGAAEYKDRWSTASRPLEELRGANCTRRAQLLGLLRDGRDLLARLSPTARRAAV